MVPSTEPSSQQFSRRSTADNTHRALGPYDPGNELGPPTGSSRCRPGFNVHRPLLEESTSFSSTPLMDNSILVYIPMKLKCGVTVNCRPDVLTRCPSVLQDLNNDVEGCLDVLPESVHSLVRRTKIWINTTYYYGPTEKPHNVNHSTAHHHEGWLFWCVYYYRIQVFETLTFTSYSCRLSYLFLGPATFPKRLEALKSTIALITKQCDCIGKEAAYCCTNSAISFINLHYQTD
jgi:hypothetical protein